MPPALGCLPRSTLIDMPTDLSAGRFCQGYCRYWPSQTLSRISFYQGLPGRGCKPVRTLSSAAWVCHWNLLGPSFSSLSMQLLIPRCCCIQGETTWQQRQRDAGTSQETERIAGHHQRWGQRLGTGSPENSGNEPTLLSLHLLVLGFSLRDNKFLTFV